MTPARSTYRKPQPQGPQPPQPPEATATSPSWSTRTTTPSTTSTTANPSPNRATRPATTTGTTKSPPPQPKAPSWSSGSSLEPSLPSSWSWSSSSKPGRAPKATTRWMRPEPTSSQPLKLHPPPWGSRTETRHPITCLLPVPWPSNACLRPERGPCHLQPPASLPTRPRWPRPAPVSMKDMSENTSTSRRFGNGTFESNYQRKIGQKTHTHIPENF